MSCSGERTLEGKLLTPKNSFFFFLLFTLNTKVVVAFVLWFLTDHLFLKVLNRNQLLQGHQSELPEGRPDGELVVISRGLPVLLPLVGHLLEDL